MKKAAWISALLVAGGLAIPIALGMGGTHPRGQTVGGSADWPDSLKALVNGTQWSRGWWVNANDFFCYSGDTAALNAFLDKLSKVEGVPLAVVLHAGGGTNRGLVGDEEAQAMDWQLRILKEGWSEEAPAKGGKGEPARVVNVHVWLGGGIDLAKLKVPPNVSTRSGGEIEEFVAKHRAQAGTSPAASKPAG